MGKPEIRFKGYTDEWEQRKLIEVCDYVDYRGKTPTKTENGIFLVTAKNVKDGFIDYETSKEYISENAYEEVMRRGKPEIGDVLITTEAPCGNVAQVNKADIALAQRIIKYRGHIGVVDNTYLKYYLLSPEFQKILNAKSSGGTVQGIKGSILHQQKIIYPSYEEQKKIGQHMDSLDHLITLHQRKCDEVKSLKKYMLQKMFPQNEQKVPEIRFEGFTEAWEQRKLGELVKERILEAPLDGNHGEKHPTSDEYVESGIPFLMASDIHNGEVNIYSCKYITKERAERLDKGFARNGDVLLTHKATIGETAILSNLMTEYAMLTPQVTYYRIKNEERLNREYLYSFFNSLDFQTELKTKAAQSTRPYIGITAQQNLKIILPTEIDEQRKIGLYFGNLDRLITLHQQKCEELKKIKKFMLQKMFV